MKLKSTLVALSLVLGSVCVYAQSVQVRNAWVRSTAAGQKATGAFMSLTAKEDTQLVSVSSPVAGVAEVHEMKMEGNVMRMRAMPMLNLPAGKTVELKSGSYHLMLMDLKQALPKGTNVPLVLHFQDASGIQTQLELSVPVSTMTPVFMATPAAGRMAPHEVPKHMH